ncbi:unnamed protein product [Rhodiola kirilowii]
MADLQENREVSVQLVQKKCPKRCIPLNPKARMISCPKLRVVRLEARQRAICTS